MIEAIKKTDAQSIMMLAVVITPLIYLPFKRVIDYFYLPKIYFLCFLLILYLVHVVTNKKEQPDVIKTDLINIFLLGYCLTLMISVYFADNIFLAIAGKTFRREGLFVLLMYMLFYLVARLSRGINKEFINYVLMTSVIVSMYGTLQFYGFDPIPHDFLLIHVRGALSSIGNPNFLGTYHVLMIPLSLHLYFKLNKRWGILVYAVLLLGILCTRTRGTWLGAIFSIMVYIYGLYRLAMIKGLPKKKVFIWILVTFFVIMGFNLTTSSMAMKRFLSIFTDAYNVASNSDNIERAGSWRFFIWKRVMILIQMKPWFGHGIEHLHLVFDNYFREDVIQIMGRRKFIDRAHNEYLHIAVSSGIPSLIFYLSFVISSLKRGMRRLFHENKVILLPFMAAVSGYLVQAFFNISVPSVAYIYWIFLGILVSGEFENIEEMKETEI